MKLPEFVVREDGMAVTLDGNAVVEPWTTQCLKERQVRDYRSGLADFNMKLESRYGARVTRSVFIRTRHGLYSVSYLSPGIGISPHPRHVHLTELGWAFDSPAMEAKVHL